MSVRRTVFSLGTRVDEVKADQIDVVARTMLRHFEEIDHTEKTRLNRQNMSDVLNGDLLDGIHLDFTSFHLVATAHLDVRTFPDSNAAGDRPVTYALSQPPGENHLRDANRHSRQPGPG